MATKKTSRWIALAPVISFGFDLAKKYRWMELYWKAQALSMNQ